MAGAPHWFNAISQNSGMVPVKGEMTYQDPATGLEYTIKVKDPSNRLFHRKKKKKERPVSDGYEHPVRPLPPPPSPPPREIEPLELDSNSEFDDPVYRQFPTGSSLLNKEASVTAKNDNPESRWSPVGDAEEEEEPMYLSLPESDDGVGKSEGDSYGKESEELYVKLKAAQKQQIMSKDRSTIAKK